jgi:hypothetical protein
MVAPVTRVPFEAIASATALVCAGISDGAPKYALWVGQIVQFGRAAASPSAK